jgi:hypothetical protein
MRPPKAELRKEEGLLRKLANFQELLRKMPPEADAGTLQTKVPQY